MRQPEDNSQEFAGKGLGSQELASQKLASQELASQEFGSQELGSKEMTGHFNMAGERARLNLGLVLLILLVLSLTACSKFLIPAPKPYLAEDRDSRWVNDLTYLEKTLPKVHKNLFFQLSAEEFHRQLAELKEKVPAYSDEQIEIELSVILAGIGDTHTGSSIGAEFRYPLELHWFAEGIYIVGTNQENAELLYGRILKLNGRKIEEAVHRIKPVLGEANESWFKAQIVYYLPIPGVLQYFGLITGEEMELGVELRSGEEKTVLLKPVSYKEYVPAERPAEPVPLYRSHLDENYWFEYLEEEKTLYFNYGSCRQMREKPFEIFNKEFWNFVQEHEADKLVVDIRDNRGGSSPLLNPFIQKVKRSGFNELGKLFVIIGRDTFSSAILNAISLKKETKAFFVGEPTGGEPNHYGEVKQFRLPNSEKPIRYSTKYFHWPEEDVKTLKPDKLIVETFAAYREGTDPVLEWILDGEF
ncbi:MAG: peptidase S41 [Desulfitobacteriia bacterium]